MNINCIICSDVFSPSAEIFVTPCGHLFHHVCLIKWLERSKTCPQCRARATDRSIHRVYFNIPNSEGMEGDIWSLYTKVDELNCQLKIKEKEATDVIEEKNTLKINHKRAIEMMKSLEGQLKKRDSDMAAYKEQLVYFKSKCALVEDIEAENGRLKEANEQLKLVEAIVKASANEADRMINKQTSAKDMVTLLSVIKRELVSSESRRKEMQRQMKRLQMDLVHAKTQQNKLKEHGDATKQLEADLRRSDREKNNAVRRVRILESELGKKKIEHQPSQRRSMSVSPRHVLTCPSVPRAYSEIDLTVKSPRAVSPTVLERVHAIQSHKSPYLSVQASSVGIMPLRTLQPKARVTKHPLNDVKEEKFSIFKKPRIQITKPRQEQFTFDGLGGQSKVSANNTKTANEKRRGNFT